MSAATVLLPRRPALDRDALIEDVTWLVETREGWSQAVIRLGYTGRPESLERRLERAGRGDLIAALKAREADWADAERARKQRTRHPSPA